MGIWNLCSTLHSLECIHGTVNYTRIRVVSHVFLRGRTKGL